MTKKATESRVGPVSAMLGHSERFYAAMYELSEPIEGNKTDRLYTGHPTKLLKDLEISGPYYGKIIADLENMGCITRLRRGARNAHSEIALHQPPTQALFLETRRDALSVKHRGDELIRDQQIRDLQQLTSDLESRIQVLENISKTP